VNNQYSFPGGSKFFFCNDARCGGGNDVSRDGQAAVNNLMAVCCGCGRA